MGGKAWLVLSRVCAIGLVTIGISSTIAYHNKSSKKENVLDRTCYENKAV